MGHPPIGCAAEGWATRKELFYPYWKTFVQTLGEQDYGEALFGPGLPVPLSFPKKHEQ
jgi:hypothetical protein